MGGLVFVSFAQVLSLNEAITKTLQNHPDIKTFMLQQKSAKKNVKSTKSSYLPQINLNGQYNFTQTYTLTTQTTNGSEFSTKNDTFGSVGVSIKQKIYDFGKTDALIQAAKTDEDISKLSLKQDKALLAYKVKVLYETMVVQKKAIIYKEADLKLKEKDYEQAVFLKNEGLKTTADESKFKSAVYEAKANLNSAKIDYEKAKKTLELYMGEQIGDVELENVKFSLPQDIRNKILQHNYGLEIAKLNIQKNKFIHKSQKQNRYGSIDLVGNYSKVYALNDYDSKMIGLSVTIPLYMGGKLSADEQKAKIALQIASTKQASEILSLKDEINSAVLDIKNYNQIIISKQSELKYLRQNRAVIEGRYKVGMATYIEVLDAQNSVLNAKLSLLEVEFQKNTTIAKLKYLEGKINE